MKNIPGAQRQIPVEAVGISGREWRMNSARGDRYIAIEDLGTAENASFSTVSIELAADFYDRTRPIKTAKIIPDFCIKLKQVAIRRGALLELNEKLLTWLDHRVEFQIRLSPDAGQNISLDLSFGRDDNWICSVDKPVLCIRYQDGASLAIDAAFVVDQSCARLWLES